LVSDFLEKKITVGASDMEERAIENIAYTVYGGEPFSFLQKNKIFGIDMESAASDTAS
jgi:hypothetical protein